MSCGLCTTMLSGLVTGLGFLGYFTLFLFSQLLIILVSWVREKVNR